IPYISRVKPPRTDRSLCTYYVKTLLTMRLHSSRGYTRTDLPQSAPDIPRTFAWHEDDRRPLDWNGPANRLFTRFRQEDLQRPIIEHFERVARRQRGRIAIRDADTAPTFGELWDGN